MTIAQLGLAVDSSDVVQATSGRERPEEAAVGRQGAAGRKIAEWSEVTRRVEVAPRRLDAGRRADHPDPGLGGGIGSGRGNRRRQGDESYGPT